MANDNDTTDTGGSHQQDVDALTELLDLMTDFSSNEQRARYLLSCNWMRDRGTAAAERIREWERKRGTWLDTGNGPGWSPPNSTEEQG